MPQDPQTNLFAIQRRSNEGFLITSEFVTSPLQTRTLQTPFEDSFKDFLEVKAYATDKSVISGREMGKQDYALYSTFTAVSESLSQDALGNEQMIPVVGLLKNEEVGEAGGGVMKSGYYEAVIDATLTHDVGTETYHLWYYINAWTPIGGENAFNSDGTLFPLVSRQYDPNVVDAFDVDNWFVVPQRNLKVSELKNAARVLLHTVGKKLHLGEGDADAGNWLVTRMPEIVAYWPFGTVAMGGLSYREPVARRVRADYTPRNLNLPPQPVYRPFTHIGGSAAPCHKFNGTIEFLCDIEFFLTPCCIAKFPGRLIVQNGEICEGSGCSCSSVSSGDCP